jgi:hypothetical protein
VKNKEDDIRKFITRNIRKFMHNDVLMIFTWIGRPGTNTEKIKDYKFISILTGKFCSFLNLLSCFLIDKILKC